MKPVYQDRLEQHGGNCYAACIASILEVGLKDIDFNILKIYPTEPQKNSEDEKMCVWRLNSEIIKNTKKRGHSLLKIKYDSFKQYVESSIPISNFCSFNEQEKEEWKKSVENNIEEIPTECYCIISIVVKDKVTQTIKGTHAIVGYIDNSLKLKRRFDPDKDSPNNLVDENNNGVEQHYTSLTFLIKTSNENSGSNLTLQ